MAKASSEVRTIVVEEVQRLLLDEKPLTGDEHLSRDLRIDSDDLSFLFIPAVESRCMANIPAREWSKVNTINEIVTLLARYSG